MPRAPARIRRKYVEGQTEVLDWELEETLVFGVPVITGPPCRLRTATEWRSEWGRWRDVILPKVIEYRPGTRPFAMYAIGEIPRRELVLPLPLSNGFWTIDVRETNGTVTTHYVDVPEPYMERQSKHLHRLGIIDDDELRRHRKWMRTPNPECDRCAVDLYPLEMSLHE